MVNLSRRKRPKYSRHWEIFYNILKFNSTHFFICVVLVYLIDNVMVRFNIPKQNRPYIIRFYLEGLNAIVKEWLEQDCEKSIDDMVQLIKECVRAT